MVTLQRKRSEAHSSQTGGGGAADGVQLHLPVSAHLSHSAHSEVITATVLCPSGNRFISAVKSDTLTAGASSGRWRNCSFWCLHLPVMSCREEGNSGSLVEFGSKTMKKPFTHTGGGVRGR